MGFNFKALLGGMAEGVSQKIDLDEKKKYLRDEKTADRLYEKTEEDRLYKRNKKRQKAEFLEETTGMLELFGYNPDEQASLLSMGTAAANEFLQINRDARARGLDGRTIFNMTKGNATDAQSILNNAESLNDPVVTQMGDITAGAKGKTQAETVGTNVQISDGFSINSEAYAQLYGEPDPIYKTFDAGLTDLSLKITRNPDSKNITQWNAQREAILQTIRDKEKAKAASGDTTKKAIFGLGTVSSNIIEIRKGAGAGYGFKVGIDGEIKNMTEGNQFLGDILNLSVARQMIERNMGIDDAGMRNATNGLYNDAMSSLTLYAQNLSQSDTGTSVLVQADSNEDFLTNAERGVYKEGQVVKTPTSIYVFTGIKDFVTTNQDTYGANYFEVGGE